MVNVRVTFPYWVRGFYGGVMTDKEFEYMVAGMTREEMQIFIDLLYENQLLPKQPYPASPSCALLIETYRYS